MVTMNYPHFLCCNYGCKQNRFVLFFLVNRIRVVSDCLFFLVIREKYIRAICTQLFEGWGGLGVKPSWHDINSHNIKKRYGVLFSF